MPVQMANYDKIEWMCLVCEKVVSDDKVKTADQVKPGDPLNPRCCGREMRPFMGKKGAEDIIVIERRSGKQPDGTTVEFHPQRPWWSRELEVRYVYSPFNLPSQAELIGYVGLGLAGRWEYLTIRGEEGFAQPRDLGTAAEIQAKQECIFKVHQLHRKKS